MSLTPGQRKILVFVAGYTDRTGCSPTFREIGFAVGLRSTNTVAWYIRRLRDAGLLAAEPTRVRTTRLADGVTVWPDGSVTRLVLVEPCWRCRTQHPADLDCRLRQAAPARDAREPHTVS